VASGPGAARRFAAQPGEPLPLNLPAPSPFPGRLALETSVPCAEPFDHPDWRFSIDWDGSRALLFAGAAGVRLQNERLVDVSERFPDLERCISRLRGRELVADGVICVLDPEGKPDLPSLGRRLAIGAAGASLLPAVFLATDLLYVDGAPILAWPAKERIRHLREVVEGMEPIQVPDDVEARGRALADAARGRGLAALLARRSDAPYHPGVASPDRLRISLVDRTTCQVVAVTADASGAVQGLILAERVAGRVVASGWAAMPKDRILSAWLERQADSLRTSEPPLQATPQGTSVRWLRPVITATVSHAGRHPDGTLRTPELIALRDDCDPAWCVRREPADPPALDAAGRGFTPTLLLPLPLEEAALLPAKPG
jgi:bifunctional non-homologous end joining protein LigD